LSQNGSSPGGAAEMEPNSIGAIPA
jgi:hypothetical protein